MRILYLQVCIIICSCYMNNLCAQPFVDPFNIRYTYAFKGNDPKATPFTHIYLGSDLPVRFKNGTILLISPFYENWNIDSAGTKQYLPAVSSVALPIGIIFPLNARWLLNVTAIARINSEGLQLNNGLQIGGLTFASYKIKENQKLRLGIYVNNDFFGLFVMPLAGIDWKIDSKNYLFGILPGRLSYEHKLSDKFYAGATFRAITNSYRFKNGNYLRIDDNRLSLYLDYYPAKKIVITLEPGYGIMRQLRMGVDRNKNYFKDYNWNDGMFINLCASYRIRL
jgi:hypothetical protein